MSESKRTVTTYPSDGLSIDNLRECSLAQLELWLQEAVGSGVVDPRVMVLATTDANGYPDQRPSW